MLSFDGEAAGASDIHEGVRVRVCWRSTARPPARYRWCARAADGLLAFDGEASGEIPFGPIDGWADGLIAFYGEAAAEIPAGRAAADGLLSFTGEAVPLVGVFPDILSVSELGAPVTASAIGYYDFETILDLGDPFERVRFSVEIEGSGVAIFDTGFTRPSDDWNAWVEIAGAEQLPTLSTWLALSEGGTPPHIPVDFDGDSVADLMMAGLWDPSYVQWTAWQPIMVGEITGRMFRFRLAIANTSIAGQNVTPLITAVRVTVDMRDRDERANNVLIAPGGLEIFFGRRFAATPAMGIALEDAVPGDSYSSKASPGSASPSRYSTRTAPRKAGRSTGSQEVMGGDYEPIRFWYYRSYPDDWRRSLGRSE